MSLDPRWVHHRNSLPYGDDEGDGDDDSDNDDGHDDEEDDDGDGDDDDDSWYIMVATDPHHHSRFCHHYSSIFILSVHQSADFKKPHLACQILERFLNST